MTWIQWNFENLILKVVVVVCWERGAQFGVWSKYNDDTMGGLDRILVWMVCTLICNYLVDFWLQLLRTYTHKQTMVREK